MLNKYLFFSFILLFSFQSCNETNSTLTPPSSETKDNIEVYSAYGNNYRVLIRGRMLHEKTPPDVEQDDSSLSNAFTALDYFFNNDEIPDKNIIATIDGKTYSTKGDDEGYFSFDITSQARLNMGYKTLTLHMEDNANTQEVNATIIDAQPHKGIISDIDDTVVISDVTSTFFLLYNTFFQNYTQRTNIATMKERFKTVLDDNIASVPNALFFISGSPKELSFAVENFLSHNDFPAHVTLLKQLKGDDQDPLLNQIRYKTAKIERLIELYPNMLWTMYGDSGEKDKDIYQSMKEKYPDKIEGYYIRNVLNGDIDFFD